MVLTLYPEVQNEPIRDVLGNFSMALASLSPAEPFNSVIARTLLLDLLVWVWIGMSGQAHWYLIKGNFSVPDSEVITPNIYHIAAAAESPRRQEEDLAKNDLQKEKEFFSTFVMSQTTSPSSASS